MGQHIHEFEKFIMNCYVRENEDQTMVRYLGGLNESIWNVVKLQHYTTIDDV